MDSIGDGASPSTFVTMAQSTDAWQWLPPHGGPTVDPRTAAVLSAVLLATAEQVSSEKLTVMQVDSALDLPLLGLAMAFQQSDTGLVGDVFEWSLLLAVNGADSEVRQIVADAMTLARLEVDEPRAVLVAAEAGRLVEYSPELPARARLATGRRGQPPLISNILDGATTSTWKADLLVGQDDRWIAASLKSNPSSLIPSLAAAAGTSHPPRIGITAVHPKYAGVSRHVETDTVIARIPVDLVFMAICKAVISDVQSAFDRHLNLPSAPIQQDVSGIGIQLHAWRQRTVRDVLELLREAAGRASLTVSEVLPTGSTTGEGGAVLIAADPLVSMDPKVLADPTDLDTAKLARALTTFEPMV